MAIAQRRRRLRRSDCSEPGLHRRRRGRGFSYVDEGGIPVTTPAVLERLRDLAIPPAWKDVWICPDPQGHLQATGIDAAGRNVLAAEYTAALIRDRSCHGTHAAVLHLST